ncbi:pantoate--beta-alanine ligase [Planctomycetota bacterium]
MQVAKTITDVRGTVKQARRQDKTIGFVPTMGALHIGHISLIEAAKKKCDFVVVSIFVNPTQFGPEEDLEQYPRPVEADLKICENLDVDIVFNPTPEVMYPAKILTWVNVEKLSEPLCGQSRQGHFKGVTTVCAKLFNIVAPDLAFFGQKDAQQAIIIKRMVTDLNMPIEIIICPTIREPNGLAMSSRNKYLTQDQKNHAALIYKSLQKCNQMIMENTANPEQIITKMRKTLERAPDIKIEYISILNAETLEPADKADKTILAAIAVKVGNTRLIDNILVDAGEK